MRLSENRRGSLTAVITSIHKKKPLFIISSIILILATSSFTFNIRAESTTSQDYSEVHIEGYVKNQAGEPLDNTHVIFFKGMLGAQPSQWIQEIEDKYLREEAWTDHQGHFVIDTNVYGSTYSYLYALYDDPDTSYIDTMPTAVKILTGVNTSSNLNITLAPAATVFVNRQITSIVSTEIMWDITYEVIDPVNGTVLSFSNLRLIYGTDIQSLDRVFGLDPTVVLVPPGVPFSLKVSAFFWVLSDEPYGMTHQEQARRVTLDFIATEGAGFLLNVGETLELDVRRYSLLSEIEKLENLVDMVGNNLTQVEKKGFYVASERFQLNRVEEYIHSGSAFIQSGHYDAAYVDFRQAFISASNILNGIANIQYEAEYSIKVLILLLAITSILLSVLLTSTLIQNIIIGFGIYAPSIVYLRMVFPGSSLIKFQEFLLMSLISILGVTSVIFLLQSLSSKGYIWKTLTRLSTFFTVFSLAKRNLRRRKLRAVFTFSTLLLLTISFVTLTSFSTGYGLTSNQIQGKTSSQTGILIRPQEYKPKSNWETGWFYPIVGSFVDWVDTVEGVSCIALKAENTPDASPLDWIDDENTDWPISGILGLQPDVEPLMDEINAATVHGTSLKQDRTCLLSNVILRSGEISLGDLVIVRGVRMEVVGFFDESIKAVKDLDGDSILPRYQVVISDERDPEPQIIASVPETSTILITTLDTALEIEDVHLSRINLVLEEDVDLVSKAQSLALTSNYRLWSSSSEGVRLHFMGETIAGKGIPLMVPWFIVVLNVVATMVNAMYERKNEIKIFSSVGLNPMHIFGIFLAESSFLGLMAGGFGYLMGLGTYQLMAGLSISLIIQQKISAYWCFAAIGISISSVLFGSLLSLQKSVVLTPSFLRRWTVDSSSVQKAHEWDFSLPLKIEIDQVDEFIDYLMNSLGKYNDSSIVPRISNLRQSREDDAWVLRFSYNEGQSSIGGIYTRNILRLEKTSGASFSISIKSIGEEKAVNNTGSFIRKMLMQWTLS